ncbi:hypothetical protein CLAVI_000717 [Candidatus Clavichlamydia salmonicola]|nr:hypothetical protein [Candidatus Clavichlamydia salmonicola]
MHRVREIFLDKTHNDYIKKTLQKGISYKTKNQAKADIFHIKKILWIQEQYKISLFILTQLHEHIALLHQQLKAFEEYALSSLQVIFLNSHLHSSSSGITLISIKSLNSNDFCEEGESTSSLLHNQNKIKNTYIFTKSILTTASLQIQAVHEKAMISKQAMENVFLQQNRLLHIHENLINDFFF